MPSTRYALFVIKPDGDSVEIGPDGLPGTAGVATKQRVALALLRFFATVDAAVSVDALGEIVHHVWEAPTGCVISHTSTPYSFRLEEI